MKYQIYTHPITKQFRVGIWETKSVGNGTGTHQVRTWLTVTAQLTGRPFIFETDDLIQAKHEIYRLLREDEINSTPWVEVADDAKD